MRNELIYDVEHHKKEGLISAKQNKATKTLYNEIERCYDEKIAWLKALNLGLKKRNEDVEKLCSNEWSEEDENIIKNLIELVEAQPAKDFYESSKDTILKRLKSLRPSWKPSEEQMRALEDALSDMPEHYKPKCTLESLYNDLKKLM